MYRVKQLDTSVDLGDFSQWLKGQGVAHKISVEGDAQVLWLENSDHVKPVLEALDRFLAEPGIRQAVEHPADDLGGTLEVRRVEAPRAICDDALAIERNREFGTAQQELH
ncbi:hypothetical protein LCGC14_2495900, partial [marine sediment metagenome]